jgi:hypothetical protein
VKRVAYWLFLLTFLLPMMVMSAAVSWLRWAEKRMHLWQEERDE